jgi:putative ABC transport system permease protein
MRISRLGRVTLRKADLLGLSLDALVQQRARTLLAIIGVTIGTFALVLSLSLGQGVDRAIVALFHTDDRLRRIVVHERYEVAADSAPREEREPKGTMSDAQRRRLGRAMVRSWSASHMQRPLAKLNAAGIARLRALEHVVNVEPVVTLEGRAILDGKEQKVVATSTGFGGRILSHRVLAGRVLTPEDDRGALVHEYLLYRWGLTDDADLSNVLGRTIRLEYRAGAPQTLEVASIVARRILNLGEKETRSLESGFERVATLVRFLPIPRDERDVLIKFFEATANRARLPEPSRTYSAEFTIVGVLRESADDDEQPGPIWNWEVQTADLLLPAGALEAFASQDPGRAESGFDQAFVTVLHEDQVKAVSGQVSALGYAAYSLGSLIDTVRMNIHMVTFAMTFVAIVALIVAAVGITNTMIMSVLERTREIGVMKALGAREGDIQLIFLVEGVVIGFIGSALGLGLGWLASLPGDSIAKSIMKPQTPLPVRGTLFIFPPWLVVGVPLLVSLFTTLAALYPAFRAARVDPVTSLRHE